MGQYKFNSAGISAQEVGTLGPTPTEPVGRSACIIGTAFGGPAFVPLTLGSLENFVNIYGNVDGTLFGPLAVNEWMRNAASVTYFRVLGVGDGKKKDSDGFVNAAGFTVGEEQPYISSSGMISSNSFANSGGPLGRTYFLGCFMSESAGETYFSSAGLQGTGSQNGIVSAAVPVVRGILMAPSGVILRLSSSGGGLDSSAPPANYVAQESTAYGTTLGSVTLFQNLNVKQEFVLLLNGYNSGSTPVTAITASLDMQAPNYFANVLNTTASLIQEQGHYLYAHWDIHPTVAILTGTGVVAAGADMPTDSNRINGTERSIFLLTSSLARNTGSVTVPNYEAFRDRFSYAKTPWFISQNFHGSPINLFRLHSLDAGSRFAQNYKVTIKNIAPQEETSTYRYGSFDVLIRNIDDPDSELSIPLESHINVNLDPSSDRYISKVIGDLNVYYDFDRPENEQRIVYEGNYALNSRFVRVEVAQEVENKSIPQEALPVGFRGIYHLVTSGSAPLAPLNNPDSSALLNADYLRNTVQPPLPMRMNNKSGNPVKTPSTNNSWGVVFNHATQDSNNLKGLNRSIEFYTKHFPTNCTTNVNVLVGDNTGQLDTAQNGILDADRFCNNLFTLENIRIVTGSNGTVDPSYDWNLAEYVRHGKIPTDDNSKTRRLQVADFLSASNNGYLRFDTIFQGGFDGINIFDNDEANLTNAAAVADMFDPVRGRLQGPTVATYRKAIEIISSPTAADFSVLAIPGLREPAVTEAAIDAAEQRFDTIYIMDLEDAETAREAVDLVKLRGLNSSFVAAYFPDVVMKPFENSSLEIIAPPSVVVLGAISLNDSIGQPWFAPAGVTRGVLSTTLKTSIPIAESEINLLYSNDINPLYATTNINGADNFASVSGVVVWGQKTMQRSESALDRVNVRRLMIEARRAVKDIALQLLFEPSRPEIISRFNATVSERLGQIQSLGGMDAYKVFVDSSTTTTTDVENNTIRGKIYIKPKKTNEFVSLEFLVSNTGEV
jgi:phage tail sheath protein FI